MTISCLTCYLLYCTAVHHYACPVQILTANPEQLLGYITPLLMCDNEEAQVEAARAYGNFSRTHEAREYMQTVRRGGEGTLGKGRQASRAYGSWVRMCEVRE